MKKAKKAISTSMPGLNRHGLLMGGATALAASAGRPGLADESRYSPEFVKWYALAKATPDALKETHTWQRANPHADRNLGPDAQLYDALGKLEAEIFARPVRSWTDVAELGIVTLYWRDAAVGSDEESDAIRELTLGRDPELKSRYRDKRSQAHLIETIARLLVKSSRRGD